MTGALASPPTAPVPDPELALGDLATGAAQARALPVYFGERDESRFGWLHLPEGSAARAAVVLCPPLGIEALNAHWVYRRLASELAASGVAALRFDYRGTGDSSGETNHVTGLVEDVAAAVRFVRDCGAPSVALVGLRVGATLAAKAAEAQPVDALVLWDLCSGRSFLREQRALKLLSVGPSVDAPDGAVELLGMVLPKGLADELRATALQPSEAPRARRTLLIERPERPRDERLHRALEGEHLECLATEGQHEFIDVEPGYSEPPERVMKDLVTWLDAQFSTERRAIVNAGRPSAVVRAPDGSCHTERAEVIVSRGLAAVVTEPARRDPAAPVAFLLNAGLIHHVGPGRLWVELARDFAARGIASVRFDLRGVGDSDGAEAPIRHAYPPEALGDVAAAIAHYCPGGARDAYLVGLCSGAYHAAEAAIVLGARAVGLLNPALFFDPAELHVPSEEEAVPAAGAAIAMNPLVRWMRSKRILVNLVEWRPIRKLRHNPRLSAMLDGASPLWAAADRLGIAKSPLRVIEALAAAGVDTLLVCGSWESRPFVRWRKRTRALEQSGALCYLSFASDDHTFFEAGNRRRAMALVRDQVATRTRADR